APSEKFDDNMNHQIKQQIKNAKNVFNAMATGFKQGALVQFTAKSSVEMVDFLQMGYNCGMKCDVLIDWDCCCCEL
ncbi:hypothetical protein ACNF30_13630, partial [Staphylococcus aureus]|uniref:hypothetical protein n=1 Tax=Staphylococcus aureus TaxID=1280 RepID=UPI003A800D98